VTVHNRVQLADETDPKYRTLDSRSLYAQRLRLAVLAAGEVIERFSAGREATTANHAEVHGIGPCPANVRQLWVRYGVQKSLVYSRHCQPGRSFQAYRSALPALPGQGPSSAA